MVEGPGVHRVAIAHRRVLVARALSATSPNGRFADGASAIDGRYLSLIEAHGKNIFYFFTKENLKNAVLQKLPEDVVVVHIHFGMSGQFRTFEYPGPEPRETTRLRLENEEEKIVAHLSAQLCVHGDIQLYRKRIATLGPDPLREDADKEIAWTKLQKTKKSIGAFLMDQALIAGIGNIYRAEILFVCGVHPDQQSSTLSRSAFEDLWTESVRLLRVGVIAGSIITVSPEEAGKPFSKLKSGERRYVYNHKNCRRCDGKVRSWTIAQRTVYACEVCQPLKEINESKTSAPETTDTLSDERENAGALDTEKIRMPTKGRASDKKAAVKKTTPTTIGLRKRKVTDGRIVEHQALKDIPTGGLVDFPSNLDQLIWPSANPKTLGKGYLMTDFYVTSPASRQSRPHCAAHFGPTSSPRTPWCFHQPLALCLQLHSTKAAYIGGIFSGKSRPRAKLGIHILSIGLTSVSVWMSRSRMIT